MSAPVDHPFVELDRKPILPSLPELQSIPEDFPKHLRAYIGSWEVRSTDFVWSLLIQPDFTLRVQTIEFIPRTRDVFTKCVTLQPARWKELPITSYMWDHLLMGVSRIPELASFAKELQLRQVHTGCIKTPDDLDSTDELGLILQTNHGWDWKPRLESTAMRIVHEEKEDKLYVAWRSPLSLTLWSRVDSRAEKEHPDSYSTVSQDAKESIIDVPHSTKASTAPTITP